MIQGLSPPATLSHQVLACRTFWREMSKAHQKRRLNLLEPLLKPVNSSQSLHNENERMPTDSMKRTKISSPLDIHEAVEWEGLFVIRSSKLKSVLAYDLDSKGIRAFSDSEISSHESNLLLVKHRVVCSRVLPSQGAGCNS